MQKVSDVLKANPREVATVTSDATVYHAIKLMDEVNFFAVAVMDNGKLVGIFTERDYARKLLLEGRSSMITRISEIMSDKVVSVQPDQSLKDCLKMMVEHNFRHLPILDGDKLVGIVSMADLAKAAIEI